MDKYEFLKKWESQSSLRLIGEERERFLNDCSMVLYLDDDILEMALKVAGQKARYDLQYIETVGLHLRQYLRRVQYESVPGGADVNDIQETYSQSRNHLTLILGGKTR